MKSIGQLGVESIVQLNKTNNIHKRKKNNEKKGIEKPHRSLYEQLDASTHLYKSACPSVGWSVSLLVGT